MPSFIIINGPNLNLLGKREPEIYGSRDFDSYLQDLRADYKVHEIEYFQSNWEGALIDKLQEVGFSIDGIILNAGAYSHTSIALADAIQSISSPVIEVHISNVYAREAFRQQSLLTAYCKGAIFGLGLNGYRLALQHLIDL